MGASGESESDVQNSPACAGGTEPGPKQAAGCAAEVGGSVGNGLAGFMGEVLARCRADWSGAVRGSAAGTDGFSPAVPGLGGRPVAARDAGHQPGKIQGSGSDLPKNTEREPQRSAA